MLSSGPDLNKPSTPLLQAAADAAGGQQYPKGALYVVATPIGNLADITLRAVHLLGLADVVACEDTRVGGALLRHLGLARELMTVQAHNEAQAAARVLQHLAAGERIAFISDAGTPAVSDPGARLVAAVAAAGHPVVPIPGVSSAVTALSVAGDVQGTAFTFTGFLPAKGQERISALRECLAAPGTQVLFEAPHRIELLAAALADEAPDRPVTLCRELTKQFETVATMAAGALPGWLRADPNRLRGEFVVVIHAAATASTDDAEAERALRVLLRELPLKQAVALAAEITGAGRNALYALALSWRDAGS